MRAAIAFLVMCSVAWADEKEKPDPLIENLKGTISQEEEIENRLQQAVELLEGRTTGPKKKKVAPQSKRKGAVGAGRAIIDGPTESALGDLIVLDASQSFADTYSWVLANSDKTFLAFEANTKLVFATGTPGDYIFVLSVASIEDGRAVVDSVKHVISIGKGPNPPPPPPPPPPDLEGLAKQVFDVAVRINDKSTAAQLASNFESIVSAIGAGAYSGDFRTAKGKIITDTQSMNQDTIQGADNDWRDDFGQELRGWLNEREKEGKLNSLNAISEVYVEIAKGLRAASK